MSRPSPSAPTADELATELQRQSHLLGAILAFGASTPDSYTAQAWSAPQPALPPLHPYQGHLRVLAADVLAQAYPTLKALLGAETWPAVAQTFWQQHPPTQGNLHLWGQPFAHWVSQQTAWQAWPYLSDMARLDWAMHESGLAPTVEFAPDTLKHLADTDAQNLVLHLMPSLRVIRSDWPVMTLYLAHQPNHTNLHWDAAQQAIHKRSAECVCICAGRITPLQLEWFNWMAALSHQNDHASATSLGALLTQHGSEVDFTDWLTTALTAGWVWHLST
jgi:hypothetical protein